MTRNKIIYDIIMILTKASYSDDSRLDPDYIGYKIDEKRAKAIRDAYRRNPVIDPTWLQDYGTLDLTNVNKAEDLNISLCECSLSKGILPAVVSLVNPLFNGVDYGVYSIRSICGSYEFYEESLQKLSFIPAESDRSKFRYFTRVGNAIYVSNQVKKVRPILILENPLDGFVLDNNYITTGNIVSGTVYVVTDGNITYNTIKYYKDQTFTGSTTTTFTGSGKIKKNVQKRVMTGDDPYPMSLVMAQEVVMQILTQEYQIEQQVIADIKNDSQDQLKLMQ